MIRQRNMHMDSDFPHFDDELISHSAESISSEEELKQALDVIDSMDWLRRDADRLSNSRDRPEFEEVKQTEEVTIYRITESKWDDVIEDLRFRDDYNYSNRVGVTTQRVHYRYADSRTTGGFRGDTALVLSIEEESD